MPKRPKRQPRKNKKKTKKRISYQVPKLNCRQLSINLPTRHLNNPQQLFKRKLSLFRQHHKLNHLYLKMPIRKQSIVLLKSHRFLSHRPHALILMLWSRSINKRSLRRNHLDSLEDFRRKLVIKKKHPPVCKKKKKRKP